VEGSGVEEEEGAEVDEGTVELLTPTAVCKRPGGMPPSKVPH
jgi:hypothetical protein